MIKTELGVNTAAFYPFNLLGVGLARHLSDSFGFDAEAFEYMPVNADKVSVTAPRQHESWRGERRFSQTLNRNPIKFALSLSTFAGMPMSSESLTKLDKKKHTVIYSTDVLLAKFAGFTDLSVQPTLNMIHPLSFYPRNGIGFTLDTQHTPQDMWTKILDTQPEQVTECHIRSGPDVATWKEHLLALYHGDAEGPLNQIESLPTNVVLVSEVSFLAILALSASLHQSPKRVYEKVNKNIRSAGANRH